MNAWWFDFSGSTGDLASRTKWKCAVFACAAKQYRKFSFPNLRSLLCRKHSDSSFPSFKRQSLFRSRKYPNKSSAPLDALTLLRSCAYFCWTSDLLPEWLVVRMSCCLSCPASYHVPLSIMSWSRKTTNHSDRFYYVVCFPTWTRFFEDCL